MEQATAPSAVRTQLEKPWLLPARILWLTALLIAVALFITGLPLRAQEIRDWYGGGLIATLRESQTGEVTVAAIGMNSTAARAGVLEGDRLLAVDGVPITSLEQANALVKGTIDSQFIVTVQTGNFPSRELTVTRESFAGNALLNYGLSSQFAVVFVLASEILFTLLCVAIASIIFWYRSDDWMALFSALIITMILVGLSLPVIVFADEINPDFSIWIDLWFALSFGSLILFFYLFPAGQFASRLSLVLAAVLGLWLTLGLFNQPLLMWYQPRLTYIALGVFWSATGVISLAHRYRHSEPFQRQQIRWIVWGVTASSLGLMLQIFPRLFILNPSGRLLSDFILYPLGQVFKACLPIAIAYAILRYRLWNIDLVINRVLVYGSLSVLTMLGYLGTVFVMNALFTGLSNPVVSFLATGLVAILFEPLRQRLQRAVNRMMYGERDDPYAVLTRLAGTLEKIPTTNEVLPSIAQTIGQTLKIPYVAILLDQEGDERLAASFGEGMHELLSFPLVYQGERIGKLQLARRAPNEQFSSADLRLIESIAHQAGAAAQTVRLHVELIHSRTQIVKEREDERLRIRRDLHDELGPLLASQGLKLAAARQVLRSKPEKAEVLLDEIAQQSQQTVADVRRLVHGLRPPALDQLGLVEAVRDLVRTEGSRLNFEVTAPAGGLPSLPAAVEVNAYRLVLEAINNVVKHARAGRCVVKFHCEMNTLVIRIEDDGIGMPKEYRAGVGLRSMRARAEEIGGDLHIESLAPHGTDFIARLPLSS